MQLRFALLLIAGLLNSCTSLKHEESSVARMDQIQYAKDLKSKRPELFKDICKPNLILKSQYRKSVLFEKESNDSIRKKNYTDALKKVDTEWADSHRSFIKEISKVIGDMHYHTKDEKNKDNKAVLRVGSYYDPKEYVGYYIGPASYKSGINTLVHPFMNITGIGYKVFFEIQTFTEHLTPNDFYNFAKALHEENFRGDLKIPMALGKMRYFFNNIVIHAQSLEDALIAERVGLKFFNQKLASTGRGADVDENLNGKVEGMDWSEFLCNRNVDQLPGDVQNYLFYKQ